MAQTPGMAASGDIEVARLVKGCLAWLDAATSLTDSHVAGVVVSSSPGGTSIGRLVVGLVVSVGASVASLSDLDGG